MTEKHGLTKEQDASIGESCPLQRMVPTVDIYENPDELVLIADLPGVVEKDLQLEIAKGVLTLEAPLAAEGSDREFYRQFKVSERIDADHSHASLQDGVLTLKLPKAAEAKPKKIEVKTLH